MSMFLPAPSPPIALSKVWLEHGVIILICIQLRPKKEVKTTLRAFKLNVSGLGVVSGSSPPRLLQMTPAERLHTYR